MMPAVQERAEPEGWLSAGLKGAGPVYLQLTELIRAAIEGGDLQPNAPLPSERKISEQLGLSRTTVRKAIEVLAADGVLEQRRGSGNFVNRRLEQQLKRLRSFSEEMRARGLEPSSVEIEKRVAPPSAEEILALNISPGTQVVRLGRIRQASGMPLAVEHVAIDQRYIGDISLIEASLYEVLRKRGFAPVRALQRMRAGPAPAQDARLLGIEEGAPALLIERRSYLPDGSVLEFTQSTYRGDSYDFVVELSTSEIEG